VHADAVVVEQRFMCEGSTTLLAGQRLLARVRQHVVLEDGPQIGTPAAQVTLFRPGFSQVRLAMLRQVVAQCKPLTTHLTRESISWWLVQLLMLTQRVFRAERAATIVPPTNERSFTSVLTFMIHKLVGAVEGSLAKATSALLGSIRVGNLNVLPQTSQPLEPLGAPATAVAQAQLVKVHAPVAPHVGTAPQLLAALLAPQLLHLRVLRDHVPGQAACVGIPLFVSA
jgi:hypothetical protein